MEDALLFALFVCLTLSRHLLLTMTLHQLRKKIFEVLQPAQLGDYASLFCDLGIQLCVLCSIVNAFIMTFDFAKHHRLFFYWTDTIIVYIFTVEYVLRLFTADFLYPSNSKFKSVCRFVTSPMAIIDLLSVAPYYLPFFFPCSLTFLRTLRLLRLLRLGKLSRYTEGLQTVALILKAKAQELVASVMVTTMLLFISSLFIYYAEHDAQPEVFRNAFSGLWWAIATLTTIGYGDIYPITVPGKILAATIALLGIGLVAVPASILSGAYMEFISEQKKEEEVPFSFCPYCGKKIPCTAVKHEDEPPKSTDEAREQKGVE